MTTTSDQPASPPAPAEPERYNGPFVSDPGQPPGPSYSPDHLPMIHAAMAQVVAEVQGAAADRETKDGPKFTFRSVGDVMNVLKPAWAKAGIHCRPREIDREQLPDAGTTSSKAPWRHWLIRMEYSFIARDGSAEIHGPFTGEGRDLGDQGTKKAHTAAYKQLLEQVFCVPFEEAEHTPGDTVVEDEKVPEGWADREAYLAGSDALRARVRALPPPEKAKARQEFLELTGVDPADDPDGWYRRLPKQTVDAFAAKLDELEGRGPAEPTEPAEPWSGRPATAEQEPPAGEAAAALPKAPEVSGKRAAWAGQEREQPGRKG
jgi:hypothetical protein